MYMDARKNYAGAFFPAMGNHECGVGSGCSTSDNCNCVAGQGGADGAYGDRPGKPRGLVHLRSHPDRLQAREHHAQQQ